MTFVHIDAEIDNYISRKRYKQINRILIWQEDKIITQRFYNGFNHNSRNVIKSIAKSIMSIATGIALDKGFIDSIDTPICNYIPHFREQRDPMHRSITIRHLLTMTSGIYWNGGIHYHCPMLEQMHRSKDWITHISDISVIDRPGTKYVYKEWDVILLAKLLDMACGDMFDLIAKYIYQPLGIESKRWYKSDCGVYYSVADGDEGENENLANLTALDLAKIGQLFMNHGMFSSERILSKAYVEQGLMPSRCNENYGYLWWLGENRYGCRGYGGQNVTVIPDKKLIFVMQATPTSRGMAYDDVVEYCLEMF